MTASTFDDSDDAGEDDEETITRPSARATSKSTPLSEKMRALIALAKADPRFRLVSEYETVKWIDPYVVFEILANNHEIARLVFFDDRAMVEHYHNGLCRNEVTGLDQAVKLAIDTLMGLRRESDKRLYHVKAEAKKKAKNENRS